MRALLLAALLATPAAAQDHTGHDMSGMTMPVAPTSAAAAASGTDLPPGDAPAPVARAEHLADRYWEPAVMARSRERDLRREHGGMTYYQLLFNLAEYQARRGRDGYRWDGEAWIGGDIDRLTVKTEGAGDRGRGPDAAELQAMFSHAVDPYWNVQAGVRQDLGRGVRRSYAVAAVEGLAPYWFDVEGALFLSDRGELLARAEAWYDQRVTQRLVLQPRVEANLAAQDVPAQGIAAGLSDLELGLRLRWEKRRELAPYVGVSWQRQFGDDVVRENGAVSVVVGFRTWF